VSDLRYSIGKFSMSQAVSVAQRDGFINDLERHPGELRKSVQGLTPAQLDTPYRPGGWTVRQVVHHLPDSHMNSYIRFKLAMTEDAPTIRGYEEDRWAELSEARSGPIEISLGLLDALHVRWVAFLRTLGQEDFKRTFIHPQHGLFRLEQSLALYAWHGKHHVAHITSLRSRQGW
jgi:hypothetical protein